VKKPALLRETLLRAVPSLASAPETLAMYIDKGRIAARSTKTLNFEYRYTVNIVVEDFAGDIDSLFVPLLAWIAQQQPDLLDRAPQEPFSFESEILDGDAADVSINLELSERVLVERLADGGMRVTHLDEPPCADMFPGVCGVMLWQGVLDDLTAATGGIVP
jgi:hypothetical protein